MSLLFKTRRAILKGEIAVANKIKNFREKRLKRISREKELLDKLENKFRSAKRLNLSPKEKQFLRMKIKRRKENIEKVKKGLTEVKKGLIEAKINAIKVKKGFDKLLDQLEGKNTKSKKRY